MQGYELKPVSLCADNQCAIVLTKNPVLHQRSHHIDIKYLVLRSQVQNGVLELKYVPTNNTERMTLLPEGYVELVSM